MKRLARLVVLFVCACLSWAGTARGDAVVDWNEIASLAITTAAPPRPGPAAMLDFAMVHAAVYDAVEAIDRRFQPYATKIPGASGSPAVAAARAAHDVLVNRFPSQAAALDLTYMNYLANNGLAGNDPGAAVGQKAAAGIIALRANDGSYPLNPPPFTGGTDPGDWRPTPSYLPGPPASESPMLIPWLGSVTPFTLECPTQFRAEPPPSLTSRRYARDYNEVKEMGADVNSGRTFEQTDLAYFWSENFFAQWNRALRAIATAHLDRIGDTARLFALANMAAADAAITCWDSKLYYAFWRPLTAIQEGDDDGNPRTDGDTSWHPLINNPNYPDYTSGANNITGAMTRSLRLFFGTDEFTFVVTSNSPFAVQKSRTYNRFSDAARDVVEARILLGIHFRFADTVARRQGQQVAKWAFRHFLRPVHERGHHDQDDCDEDDD